jgi:DNA-binding MarR family transcriptional regulator
VDSTQSRGDSGTGMAAGSGPGPPVRADLAAALGLDTAGRIAGRLFGLAPLLVELQDLGAREYGMTYARGRVVAALHASGPVLMRALSEAIGVSPRTITGLIDALEADGWAERRPHPTDRRATIVALTPAAEAAFARLLHGYRGLARDMLAGVPEADQECALAVIEHIAAHLDNAVRRGTTAFDALPPLQVPTPPAQPRRGRKPAT